MSHISKKMVWMCLLPILAGCQTPITFEGDKDVHLTWEKAQVVLPNGEHVNLNDEKFQAFTKSKQFPVIVYIHGSGGIGKIEKPIYWPVYARALGAILIAPDSFARPNRSMHLLTLWDAERKNEIDYTRAQLHIAPWADKKNLFLLGQSAGAIAIAGYNKSGFRAAVLTGFNCHYNRYSIDLPPDIPVLSAQHPFDPVFSSRDRGTGTCENALKDRPGSEAFEWDTPAIHDGNMVPAVRGKVIEFLKRNMQ